MQNPQALTQYLMQIAIVMVVAIDVGLIGLWGWFQLKAPAETSVEEQPEAFPDDNVPVDHSSLPSDATLQGVLPCSDASDTAEEVRAPSPANSAPRNLAFASKWSLVHPWLVLQVGFLGAGIAQIILAIPILDDLRSQGVSALGSPYATAIIVIGAMLQNVVFVCLSSLFLKRYGSSLRAIGLIRPTKQQVLFGFFASILMLVAAMLLEKVLAGALSLLPPQLAKLVRATEETTAGGLFSNIHSNSLKLLFALAASIAAPIGEEVLFRGLLYNALKHRWGVRSAVILSALCFAVVHFGPLAVIVIFPMGIVLAIVYQRTQNLWVTIIMHVLHNAAAFALAMHAAK